jgi:Rod binding domain-containing protein
MDIIAGASSAPLTADQTTALKKLHDAATQLEGVFVGMLFKEMHSDKPDADIFG